MALWDIHPLCKERVYLYSHLWPVLHSKWPVCPLNWTDNPRAGHEGGRGSKNCRIKCSNMYRCRKKGFPGLGHL